MERFNISCTNVSGYRLYDTIYSDNIYKDIAEWLKDNISIEAIKNSYGGYRSGNRGCTIKIEDDNGAEEELWLRLTNDGGFFIQYPRGRVTEPEFVRRFPKESELEPKYLTALDAETNDYKYYALIPNPNGSGFASDYGRLGQQKGTFQYQNNNSKDGDYDFPIQMFWIKYYEKIAKGYKDQSDEIDFGKYGRKKFTNVDKAKDVKTVYTEIGDSEIKRITDYLMAKQRDFVKQNYVTQTTGKGSDEVVVLTATAKAIENADKLLGDFEKACNGRLKYMVTDAEVKRIYAELLQTLPRAITNVKSYIGRIDFSDETSPNYVAKVVENERNLLTAFTDVFNDAHKDKKFVPEVSLKNADVNVIKETILSLNKLKAERPTFKEQWDTEDRCCSKNGSGQIEDERHLVSRVLKVTNEKTQKRFDEIKKSLGISNKDCHLMFHGSRTENWWSIWKNGMSLNPNAIITGKMFGQGLYFAPLARKALGYTDFQGSYWSHGRERFGYLALFDVAMGKPYKPTSSLGSSFRVNNLPAGTQSVWAYPGNSGFLRNEECIVYREEQCTIKYLIEMDSQRQKFMAFTHNEIRKLKCENPVYNKEAQTIEVECDLAKHIKNGKLTDNTLVYDIRKDAVICPAGLTLTKAETEYLTDCFKNNFAESYDRFKDWLKDFSEGRRIRTGKIADKSDFKYRYEKVEV